MTVCGVKRVGVGTAERQEERKRWGEARREGRVKKVKQRDKLGPEC